MSGALRQVKNYAGLVYHKVDLEDQRILKVDVTQKYQFNNLQVNVVAKIRNELIFNDKQQIAACENFICYALKNHIRVVHKPSGKAEKFTFKEDSCFQDIRFFSKKDHRLALLNDDGFLYIEDFVTVGPVIQATDKDNDRREKSKAIEIKKNTVAVVKLPVDSQLDLYQETQKFQAWHPTNRELLLVGDNCKLYMLWITELQRNRDDGLGYVDLDRLIKNPGQWRYGVVQIPGIKAEEATATAATFTPSGKYIIFGTSCGDIKIASMPNRKNCEQIMSNMQELCQVQFTFQAFDNRRVSSIQMAPIEENEDVFVVANETGDRIVTYHMNLDNELDTCGQRRIAEVERLQILDFVNGQDSFETDIHCRIMCSRETSLMFVANAKKNRLYIFLFEGSGEGMRISKLVPCKVKYNIMQMDGVFSDKSIVRLFEFERQEPFIRVYTYQHQMVQEYFIAANGCRRDSGDTSGLEDAREGADPQEQVGVPTPAGNDTLGHGQAAQGTAYMGGMRGAEEVNCGDGVDDRGGTLGAVHQGGEQGDEWPSNAARGRVRTPSTQWGNDRMEVDNMAALPQRRQWQAGQAYVDRDVDMGASPADGDGSLLQEIKQMRKEMKAQINQVQQEVQQQLQEHRQRVESEQASRSERDQDVRRVLEAIGDQLSSQLPEKIQEYVMQLQEASFDEIQRHQQGSTDHGGGGVTKESVDQIVRHVLPEAVRNNLNATLSEQLKSVFQRVVVPRLEEAVNLMLAQVQSSVQAQVSESIRSGMTGVQTSTESKVDKIMVQLQQLQCQVKETNDIINSAVMGQMPKEEEGHPTVAPNRQIILGMVEEGKTCEAVSSAVNLGDRSLIAEVIGLVTTEDVFSEPLQLSAETCLVLAEICAEQLRLDSQLGMEQATEWLQQICMVLVNVPSHLEDMRRQVFQKVNGHLQFLQTEQPTLSFDTKQQLKVVQLMMKQGMQG